MPYIVVPATGVQHRFVFELRYECGELYWDRCGRIARTLASREGWALQSIDLNGCHIWNEDKNLIFSYSATKLDLTQAQSQDVTELLSPGEFAQIVEEFAEVVIRSLDVSSFPRIGFRRWMLYAAESVEEASSWIGRMSFFFPCDVLANLGDLSYVSHTVVVARSTRMVRVAVTPFEQQVRLAPSVIAAARAKSHKHNRGQDKVLIQKMKAQKAIKAYPAVGMMVDLDAYIEEVPYPHEVCAHTFINEATSDFTTICDAIFQEEKQQ